VEDHAASPLFDERERAALDYADAVTRTGQEIPDELLDRLRPHFDDDALVELTAIIAWENASSKFNHALGVPSQHLWRQTRWPRGETGSQPSGRLPDVLSDGEV
jgi:alkylhydroperoxidase family enzyme